MTEREKKALRNIKSACDWLIGGLENTLSDYEENSEEYKDAYKLLNNHDYLVNELYEMATSNLYGVGLCSFNSLAKSYIKDIRFCGKEWLMEMCEKRIRKEGY